jgi:hypothetical protein
MRCLSYPLQFDERDVETEHGFATKALAIERASPSYANLNHRATSRLYGNSLSRLLRFFTELAFAIRLACRLESAGGWMSGTPGAVAEVESIA